VLYGDRMHDAYEQKVRVLLGDDVLQELHRHSTASRKRRLHLLREALDRLPGGSIPFLQVFNLWRTDVAVLNLLRSAAVAGSAAQLLGAKRGDRLRLYQDSLFVKRVGDGPTHWHSDLAMAPLDTNAFVTAWIPLQPVPPPNKGGSALVFAGGSHRDVALPFWHGDPRVCEDLSGRGYTEHEPEAMAVGDVTFHHGWTLHFAPPNTGPTPRRALTASYFLDGALRLGGSARQNDEDIESHTEWSRHVPPGKPARHALLPVVWPPEARDQGQRGDRVNTRLGRKYDGSRGSSRREPQPRRGGKRNLQRGVWRRE